MKLFARLGSLGRQIRGWLPIEPVAVAATLNDRRRVFISGAGVFFIAIGAFYLPTVIPSYYVMNGPLAQLLCPPRAPCAPIDMDLALIAPVLLMVIGELGVAFGLYFRAERHRRPIKIAVATAGVFSATVGMLFLSYVPSIPPYEYICYSTVCTASMAPITPIFLIAFGTAVIAVGLLYRRRHKTS